MCRVAAGEVNEGISRVHDGSYFVSSLFISLFFYCNGVMKLDSVRVIVSQRGCDRCASSDRGRPVLPFVFLHD